MEHAEKLTKKNPALPPYDYIENLNRFHAVLGAKSGTMKSTIHTVSDEIKALDKLRRRMKTMLLDVTAALEHDMAAEMKSTELLANTSLMSSQVRVDSMDTIVEPVCNMSCLLERVPM